MSIIYEGNRQWRKESEGCRMGMNWGDKKETWQGGEDGWGGGAQGEWWGTETHSLRVFQPEIFKSTFSAFAGVSACTACAAEFHEIATGTCARARNVWRALCPLLEIAQNQWTIAMSYLHATVKQFPLVLLRLNNLKGWLNTFIWCEQDLGSVWCCRLSLNDFGTGRHG